jgi:hypothetical protein
MIEEFEFLTENQGVTEEKNISKKDENILDFDINSMFDKKTWSTTLEEHRQNKVSKKPKKSFSLDEVEEENNYDQEEEETDEVKNVSPGSPGVEKDEEEIKETRKDMATLVIMLFDMAVDTSINIFTPYKIEQTLSDNDKKRKQLERVCVKIMAKYEFEPNVWTEFLTVLSVYGMEKYSSLKRKDQEEKKIVSKKEKVSNLDKIENKVKDQEQTKKVNKSQGIADLL